MPEGDRGAHKAQGRVLGHELEGSSPGQQVGPTFCLPCGGPTGVPCEAVGVREARPVTVFKGLAPSWQKTPL